MRLPVMAASLVLVVSCARPHFSTEAVDRVKRAVRNGEALLVDVREAHEWDAGHLLDARSLPLSSLTAKNAAMSSLPRGKPIYTHCMVGVRARKAAAILRRLGYDARPLKQGYVELAGAGFEQAPRTGSPPLR